MNKKLDSSISGSGTNGLGFFVFHFPAFRSNLCRKSRGFPLQSGLSRILLAFSETFRLSFR